jgi:UDP-N-acetylmuramate--alanine ligase
VFERYKAIHFVGIGGVGMSGIAEVLANLGYEVTGTDLKESETTRRLQALGVSIRIGHAAEHIGNAHVVVISSAVSPDNPEVVEAKKRSVPVIPRAEMLAELARMKYGILVAGAHGKTTTTSLVSTVLGSGGFDPTIVIGGKLKAIGSNARLGRGEFLVAEADESDGSFLKLSPTIAVVTNIDREHMDFFKSLEALKEAFLAFINKVPFYGAAFICIENEYVRELLPSIHRRYITYGFSERADIRALNIKKDFMSSAFDVIFRDNMIGSFRLPIPGDHNVLNSLACIGVALELKMHPAAINEALNAFGGIQRRFEFKGEGRGIRVYDDYGHHPTEIRATLAAAKDNMRYLREGAKLHVVFQPHRYTRTADLMEEFAGSFSDAGSLILLDIYAAGEKAVDGVSSEALAEKIRNHGSKDLLYFRDRDEAMRHLYGTMKEGDLLLTLGAGDVWKLGEKMVEMLNAD